MDKKQFKRLINYILKNNGATINASGALVSMAGGYVVSDKKYNLKIKNITNLKLKTINKLLKIAGAFNLYVGVWYDGKNKRYEIDANYILKDLQHAVIKARANKQRAIYDLKNNIDIIISY